MGKNKKKAEKVKKKPAAKAAKPVKKAAAPEKPKKAVAKKAAAKPAAAAKKAAPKKPSPVPAPKAVAKKAAAPEKPKKPLATAKPVKAAPPMPEKVAKKGKGKAPKEAPPEEIVEVLEADAAEEEEGSDEVVLTDAEGRRYCRVKDCDQLASVDGYCRYHYLLYWKRIQVRKKILTEGKLERYVEELTSRYPDKFLDMLKKDLRSEKEFLAAIQELEIDESANENELEDETQTYIDEVRGMGETPAREDDGDF
jgi:hypothetical protein